MNPTPSQQTLADTFASPSAVRATVLVVGDWQHFEFASLKPLLTRATAIADLGAAKDAILGGKIDPGWIVIFASRPGQFTGEQVESLAQAAPLAKTLACLGGWHEGETRTGFPWPGIHRVYWHQFEHRWSTIFQGAQEGVCSSLELSRTWLTVDETMARDKFDREQRQIRSVDENQESKGLIAIRTVDATTFECFADTCQKLGYAAVWLPAVRTRQPMLPRRMDAILWFGDLTKRIEVERLRELQIATSDCPIIAMAHFPRRGDVQLALGQGAATVVSLPCWDDEIRRAIESVTSPSPS